MRRLLGSQLRPIEQLPRRFDPIVLSIEKLAGRNLNNA